MKCLPCLPRAGLAHLITCDAMGTATTDITSSAGHRKRLRERLLKSGGDALHDYELLEMVLLVKHHTIQESLKLIKEHMF